MIIWNSFKDGIKNVWDYKFLALIFFLFKFFFAFLLLIPAYYMFAQTFSFSPSSVDFLKGYDFYLLVDFLSKWSKGRSLYWIYFLIIFSVSFLGYIFLSGGFWGALHQGLKQGNQKLKGEKFLKDCGRYFGSFLKIFLFICILYILAFICGLIIFSLIQAISGKEFSYTLRILIAGLELVILAILFMWVNMWSYYLRANRILFEEKKLLRMVSSSLNFIFRNFGKTISLYYLLSLILLGTLMAYFGLNKILHFLPMDKFLVITLFILYQFQSLFRSFYKLVYYSSHMVLFAKLYDLK